MKGLASKNKSFSRINVRGRCARRHYGLEVHKKFDAIIHAPIADKRYGYPSLTMLLSSYNTNLYIFICSYFSVFEGEIRIATMTWFIKKVNQASNSL